MNETPGLMTFDEWAKLPAEDRHRYILLVQEIQQLYGDNAKLRADLVEHRINAELSTAENTRLKAALKPFADMAEIVTKMECKALEYGSTKYYFFYAKQSADDKPMYLTADDFRNALNALKGGAA